jgi:hypothetical protein
VSEGESHDKTGGASLHLTGGIRPEGGVSSEVERGLNDIRLAVLGILVTIGLTVGFGVASWYSWWGVLAGTVSFAVGCWLIKWRWSRNKMMTFAHWLSGH